MYIKSLLRISTADGRKRKRVHGTQVKHFSVIPHQIILNLTEIKLKVLEMHVYIEIQVLTF